MNKQYLGNAADAFKWDYLDFLVRELKVQRLNILLMPTDIEQGKPGYCKFKSPLIWPFCEQLYQERDFSLLRCLPSYTSTKRGSAQYEVYLHKEEACFSNRDRAQYFSGIKQDKPQVIFADPDVGLEPPKAISKKHIKYSEVKGILKDMSRESVFVVFQRSRHECNSLLNIYLGIKPRLADSQSATAICWGNQVMLVAIGEKSRIEEVSRINCVYKQLPRDVYMLDCQSPDYGVNPAAASG